ncbi:Copper transport protein ATX1 [Spatholobus suberectus]|nr:Copper transport protein ATX1 [Spatholobus suberectus]
MGEEEKKAEGSKAEEEKKTEEPKKEEEKKEEAKKPDEEKKPEESKDDKESKEEAAPPEIVLKVFMHCEGCARKVRRSLKGFPGENECVCVCVTFVFKPFIFARCLILDFVRISGVDVILTDCKSHKVVVKGEKADPLKVLERVQRKSHRKVELLSPIPKPPAEEEIKPEEKEKPNPEENKEEPQAIAVVLKVHMHCEACAQEIKRRIERMKGVESAEPDLKSSQVSVKGVFETAKLVEHVYKRTGKHAVIVKEEPEKKEEAKEEKKAGEGDKKGEKGSGEGEENKEKKGGEGEAKPAEVASEETTVVELKKNEYYYNPPSMGFFHAYPGQGQDYPPQIFSDENPNACSVM